MYPSLISVNACLLGSNTTYGRDKNNILWKKDYVSVAYAEIWCEHYQNIIKNYGSVIPHSEWIKVD